MESADAWRGRRALQKALRPSEKLADALLDPARRERTMLVALAAYILAWTLYAIIAKSSQDMQVDAAELVAWSHHLALGYAKHPPLAAWFVRAWFSVFPIRDSAYYLFAIAYATAGLWVAWRLYGHCLAPDKRVVALACLTLVPYFNFHGIRFDHNAVLGPLWAATALFFIRSFEARSAGWAALAGAAAAAAMLGKYWSIFLLAGLALAAVLDTRRTDYFRSAAPWITVGVGAALLAPHLIWLTEHGFMPFVYAKGAHGVKSFADTFMRTGRYVLGGLGYAAVPTLIVLALSRPRAAALADILWPRAPERRFVAVAFWATLLLPVLVGPLLGIDLNPIWTMPCLILFPIVLLSSPLLKLGRQALVAVTALVVTLPLMMLAASPGIALAIHKAGPDPVSAHAKLLAARVEQEWRRITDRPLRIVAGEFGLAQTTVFYLTEQPAAFPVIEPETAPWVTRAAIARDGAVIVCQLVPGNPNCVIEQAIEKAIVRNPPPRPRVVVTLTRRFLGFDGKPQRYLIEFVSPAK